MVKQIQSLYYTMTTVPSALFCFSVKVVVPKAAIT